MNGNVPFRQPVVVEFGVGVRHGLCAENGLHSRSLGVELQVWIARHPAETRLLQLLCRPEGELLRNASLTIRYRQTGPTTAVWPHWLLDTGRTHG
jgi:hypothetical protein